MRAFAVGRFRSYLIFYRHTGSLTARLRRSGHLPRRAPALRCFPSDAVVPPANCWRAPNCLRLANAHSISAERNPARIPTVLNKRLLEGGGSPPRAAIVQLPQAKPFD